MDLETLMRDRLRDEHPDLDSLLAVAVHRGRRIRTVRRLGTGLAAAAVLAGVGIGAVAATGGVGGTTTVEPAGPGGAAPSGPKTPQALVATAPAPLAAGTNLRLPGGTVAHVQSDARPAPPGHTVIVQRRRNLYVVMPGHAERSDIEYVLHTYRGTALLPMPLGDEKAAPPQPAPASPTLAGWKCGPAGDEKFTCTGPGGKQAEFVWYPASAYADWTSGNPDKAADWVSTVHHGVFMVIHLDAGATAADAQALGDSLAWK